MPQDIYFASNIEVKNPLVPHGIAGIICGLMAVILSIFALNNLFEPLRRTANAGNFDEPSAYMVGILIVGIISIILLIWGIKTFFLGLRRLGKIVPPVGIPKDMNYQTVADVLVRREMPIYSYPRTGPIAWARKFISDKIPFLTERSRMVVDENYRFVKRVIFIMVLVIIVIVGQEFIPPQVHAEIDSPIKSLGLPWMFLVLLIAAAIIKIAIIFFIIPQAGPRADVLESIKSLKGAGDPMTLASEVEQNLMEARYKDIPNRSQRFGFTETEGGVQDTGKFWGKLFVETQPVNRKYAHPSSIYIYLGVGAVIFIIGAVILTRMPAAVVYSTGEQTALAILGFIYMKIVGIIAASIGNHMVHQCYYVLASYRFESVMIYVDVEGSFGKTRIRAGKGITDSFESSNVVVRSDCQVKIYSAKLLTEVFELEGPRHVIGMIVDDQTRSVERLVLDGIDNFSKGGVAVRGIDVTDQSISDLAKANIAYHQARKIAKPDARLQLENGDGRKKEVLPDPEAVSESKPAADPQTTPGNIPQPSSPDLKVCPDCAEEVKAAARKCRFCGYIFEDTR